MFQLRLDTLNQLKGKLDEQLKSVNSVESENKQMQ